MKPAVLAGLSAEGHLQRSENGKTRETYFTRRHRQLYAHGTRAPLLGYVAHRHARSAGPARVHARRLGIIASSTRVERIEAAGRRTSYRSRCSSTTGAEASETYGHLYREHTAGMGEPEEVARPSDEAPVARGGADDNIQVLVRVRPPNAREMEQVRPSLARHIADGPTLGERSNEPLGEAKQQPTMERMGGRRGGGSRVDVVRAFAGSIPASGEDDGSHRRDRNTRARGEARASGGRPVVSCGPVFLFFFAGGVPVFPVRLASSVPGVHAADDAPSP